MKFKKIQKVQESRFITRYDVLYEAVDGREKNYEMVSRLKDMQTLEDLHNPTVDSIVLIMMDENGERLLLTREFRLAIGDWVYNFPAGLIDEGETPMDAAKRELKEETGLELFEVDEVMHESYSSIGFSNEKNICIMGKARGEFQESSSVFEEIEPVWVTKAEVPELLAKEHFTARAQSFCYLWAKM